MARLPRVVVADVAHHVTQRGNARQYILDCEGTRGQTGRFLVICGAQLR
jgi:hypothetical protein